MNSGYDYNPGLDWRGDPDISDELLRQQAEQEYDDAVVALIGTILAGVAENGSIPTAASMKVLAAVAGVKRARLAWQA